MNNFIWSFEYLSELCHHKKSVVREWAVGRLSLLYPERAHDIAINLLNDEDDEVVTTSVYHFLNHPQARYKDDLLSFYKKSSGHRSGKFAHILAKLYSERSKSIGDNFLIEAFKKKYDSNKSADLMGYSLSVLHIARLHADESKEIAEASLKFIANLGGHDITIAGLLFDANLEAGTEINKLLSICFSKPDNLELLQRLLIGIGEYCGSWHQIEDFDEEGEKGFFKHKFPYMIQDSLSFIESQGYLDIKEKIERLFKKEKYDEIISLIFNETSLLLETKKIEHGEGSFVLWQKGRGKPRQSISAISAFRDIVKAAPEAFKKYIARSSLSLFAKLIEYRNLIGLNHENMDMETILNCLLQERGDVEEDERLIEVLAAAGERGRVLEKCLNHIKIRPDSWANPRIVKLIGNMKDRETIAQLLEIGTEYEDLWGEIVLAAINLGAEAVSIIKPIFERFDRDKIDYALEILEDIPTADSSDIIIKHWDTLWSFDKEELLLTVKGIGDRRFIEPLKRELKEGQILEAEAFYLLCLINRVIDPQLRNIEQDINRHEEEVIQRLESSTPGGLLKGHIFIELKCRTCRKPYNYEVNKVMIDTESRDKYIMEEIKCKNCGVVDNYEITPHGEMAITSYLMLLISAAKMDKHDLEYSVIVMGRTSPIDGKTMTIDEAVRYYEKKVSDYPANPEYLLAYANTLRTARRTEDSIPYFKNVLEKDHLSVEAYVSLGDIAKNKGDYKLAYEYQKRASEIIHTGNYYRVKQDIDQFKEAVLDNLLWLEEELGIKPVLIQKTESVIKHPKVGRNAPCPCGSGRKHKKCCLPKELGQKTAAVAAVNPKETALTDRLVKYSEKERFKKDYFNAIALYWRTEPVEPFILPERAIEDKGGFNEWFVNDYILSSKRTIIEEFYHEMQNKLTEEEREILKSYMNSYTNIYEIMEITEGVGFKIKDIFTNREIDVREIRGSHVLVKWDIILVRIYTLNGVNRILSAAAQTIPRDLKDGVKEFLNREFEKFKKETGETEWSRFIKNRSYIVEHYLEDIKEEKKILLTEERHKIIVSKAHFDVRDDKAVLEEILELFYNEYDFVIDEVSREGKEAKLTWFKRGKSKDLQESKERHEKGIVMLSKMIHKSGQIEWAVLGNITITPHKLILECLSKERLERGKQRLKEILKDLITYRIDTFEDIEKAMEKVRTTKKRKEAHEPSEEGRLIMEAQLIKQFKGWLDEKITALSGMTPREAVKSAEGREKVIELIKYFENMEERKRKEGDLYFDVSIYRKELGLE